MGRRPAAAADPCSDALIGVRPRHPVRLDALSYPVAGQPGCGGLRAQRPGRAVRVGQEGEQGVAPGVVQMRPGNSAGSPPSWVYVWRAARLPLPW